jgi:hypothetical protein
VGELLKRLWRWATTVKAVDPDEGAWAGYYGTFDTGLAREATVIQLPVQQQSDPCQCHGCRLDRESAKYAEDDYPA